MMNWRDINDLFDIKRLLPGYEVNKWIFRVAFLFCLLILLSVAYKYNFDFSNHFFYGCPSDAPSRCENAFYLSGRDECRTMPALCIRETLAPGEYFGVPEPAGFSSDIQLAQVFVVLVMLLALVLNHYGSKKNREFGLWMKIKNGVRDANQDNNENN